MKVLCPTCRDAVIWSADSPYRPFCSKRCQLIDLGEWANEEKALPAQGENQQATHQSPPDVEEIEAMLSEQGDSFFK